MRESVRTFVVLSVVFCAVGYEDAEDLFEDQRCVLMNGSLGICKRIFECKTAQDELRRRVKPSICGFDGSFPIVCCGDGLGGVPEKPAILGYGPKGNIEFQCGASLISDQFVLTAAHCLESRESNRNNLFIVYSEPVSLVRLGDIDIASDTEFAEPQNFGVSQTYPHPEYDFETFYNDIALIKLDRPVIYTKYVKPACLQSKFDLEHDNLTATGWGALNFGGTLHSILQEANLKSLPIRNCLPTYGPQKRLPKGIDEELQISGGNLEERMDTCQGDSGGPLQLRIQDFPLVHRVVGVTSFGNNCGLVPGVYTRISRYISWIESIVWPN